MLAVMWGCRNLQHYCWECELEQLFWRTIWLYTVKIVCVQLTISSSILDTYPQEPYAYGGERGEDGSWDWRYNGIII